MGNIQIDGVDRDISHLSFFVHVLAGKGHEGADLRVGVRLGLHTISRACEPGEVANMSDENGTPRVFCEDRYAFSIGLPELTRRMIDQKYYCWESSDRNRSINYAVIDVAPGRILQLQDGEHQVIFFYLYPGNPEVSDVDLNITSCHSRYMKFKPSNRRYDTHTLLRTCLYKRKRVP